MVINALTDGVVEVSADIMLGVGVDLLPCASFIAVLATVGTLLEIMMSVSEYAVGVLVGDV